MCCDRLFCSESSQLGNRCERRVCVERPTIECQGTVIAAALVTGNQNYGWVLKLNKMTGKVRVLERMTLPEVPTTWDVANGDPPGHYLISAFIENSAPVQFEFDVIDPR